MRCKAVIFDMDGTILDTLGDLCGGTNAALRHFGMPEISLDDTRRYVGNGAKRLLTLAAPEGTDEQTLERMLSWFKVYYESHCRISTAPYPGIPELLASLQKAGASLAVVSNKPDAAVQELSRSFFDGFFACSVGERPGVRLKPAADTLLSAVAELGVALSDCVYVGDSEVDVMTARNASMDCISVSWGFRTPAELTAAGATRIEQSPESLCRYLLG